MLILGGLFSFLIGVLILPLSLIGLIFLIGAAGFTPFVTSFVYLRNGIRGLRSQDINSPYQSRFQVALASVVIALALPVFVSMQLSRAVSSSIDTLINGDAAQAERTKNRMKWLTFIPESETHRLVSAYEREFNPAKKEILRQAYTTLTGQDINHRRLLLD